MAHSKSEIKKAKNLLSKYALKGEQLAFINSKEAKLLKKMGGAGKMTKAGIRSYAEDEEDQNAMNSSHCDRKANSRRCTSLLLDSSLAYTMLNALPEEEQEEE